MTVEDKAHGSKVVVIQTIDGMKKKFGKMLHRYGSIRDTKFDSMFKYEDAFNSLDDWVLDKRGFVKEDINLGREAGLCVCIECISWSARRKYPPKYSLANGIWTGEIPGCLPELTFLEEMTIGLVRINKCILKIKLYYLLCEERKYEVTQYATRACHKFQTRSV